MATISSYTAGTKVGNSLKDFLLLPELTPGDEPSYQACKTVFTHHPLGQKMAETPVTMAQSQEREIAVPGAPANAVQAYKDEFNGLGAAEAIRGTKVLARVYGVASCGVLAEGVPANRPLTPKQLRDLKIAFNIWDPLNTAGSLVLNQNPNALDFLKPGGELAVSGQSYHPSRTFTVFNERPIFLSWSNPAFGFVGRSIYQRAWYPLKSFLKTMITDDLVATKAGVIVAKIKMAGSAVDNIIATATGQKRDVVKEAEVGNVINITPDEAIESINLQNLKDPMLMARENILKNCAMAADMPALLLNEETYVEGFGEGTEDAKRVAQYIKRMREEMNPHYGWFDEIAMHRAWPPEFYQTVQRRFPNVFGKIAYIEAFYAWKNGFKAEWPNYIVEPDSEKIKTQEVILRAAVAAAEVLLPISDPSNQVAIALWLCDTFNDQTMLFKSPLEIDVEAMEDFLEEQKDQADQLSKMGAGGDGGGEDGDESTGPGGMEKPKLPKPPAPRGISDSANDRVSRALGGLHDAIGRLPQGDTRQRTERLMDGLAKRSGVPAMTEIGRLALRVEGEFWCAYFAPNQTDMVGSLLIGSIRMSRVKDPAIKNAFMALMQLAYGDAVREVTGQRPTWGAPRAAPERERSGTA